MKTSFVQLLIHAEFFQDGARLGIRHGSSRVIEILRAAINPEPVSIQLVRLQVPAICYDNVPRTPENGIRHYRSVTPRTEASGNVPLPVIVTPNSLIIIFQPKFFSLLT